MSDFNLKFKLKSNLEQQFTRIQGREKGSKGVNIPSDGTNNYFFGVNSCSQSEEIITHKIWAHEQIFVPFANNYVLGYFSQCIPKELLNSKAGIKIKNEIRKEEK